MTVYTPTFKVLKWLLITSWTMSKFHDVVHEAPLAIWLSHYYLLPPPWALVHPIPLYPLPISGLFGKFLLPGKIQLGVISSIKSLPLQPLFLHPRKIAKCLCSLLPECCSTPLLVYFLADYELQNSGLFIFVSSMTAKQQVISKYQFKKSRLWVVAEQLDALARCLYIGPI